MAGALAGLALATPFVVAAWLQGAEPQPEHEVLAPFTDPELTESSGLVVEGGTWLSVNDSGDTGRVFVVDPDSGGTLRTVHFHDDVVDVEALAPGPDGSVWVGDIGDNLARRDHISLYRVPLDGGTPTRIDVRHPDAPHDAETLLRHPSTGVLYVVTKQVLGGTVLRVPEHGSGVRTLEPVGNVPGLLTDGSFTPDGSALLLRGYARGYVYSWPGLELLDTVDLPAQRQGETLAVEPDGSVLIGSEGPGEPVLRMSSWTDALAVAPPSTGPSPSASPAGTTGRFAAPGTGEQDPSGSTTRTTAPWLSGATALLLAAAVFRARTRPR